MVCTRKNPFRFRKKKNKCLAKAIKFSIHLSKNPPPPCWEQLKELVGPADGRHFGGASSIKMTGATAGLNQIEFSFAIKSEDPAPVFWIETWWRSWFNGTDETGAPSRVCTMRVMWIERLESISRSSSRWLPASESVPNGRSHLGLTGGATVARFQLVPPYVWPQEPTLSSRSPVAD